MKFLNKKINVVHDSDLEKFLRKVWVLDDIINGKKKCKFTDSQITLWNFYSIFKKWGDLKFVSDSPIAIKDFSIYLNKQR